MAHAVTQLKLGVNERTRVLNVTRLHLIRSRIPPPPPQNDLRRDIASRRAVVKLPPVAAITNKRTKRLLLLALVALIAIGCILILRPSHHSTVYKGKTIDQWLEECTVEETRLIADRTLTEAGDLALPDLVRAVTRRPSFFYKYIVPRLPRPLKELVPPNKQSELQFGAEQVIKYMPLRSEQAVPALRKAINECDYDGLRIINHLIFHFVQKDSSGMHEVASAIPELQHALSRMKDNFGSAASEIREVESIVKAHAQLAS